MASMAKEMRTSEDQSSQVQGERQVSEVIQVHLQSTTYFCMHILKVRREPDLSAVGQQPTLVKPFSRFSPSIDPRLYPYIKSDHFVAYKLVTFSCLIKPFSYIVTKMPPMWLLSSYLDDDASFHGLKAFWTAFLERLSQPRKSSSGVLESRCLYVIDTKRFLERRHGSNSGLGRHVYGGDDDYFSLGLRTYWYRCRCAIDFHPYAPP